MNEFFHQKYHPNSTLKVEFLKIWTFVCPELGICGQAYFKVQVSTSGQLILLYRMWETNEKSIKIWWFFRVSFFWCLASTQRVCRRPRILLSEAEALRVMLGRSRDNFELKFELADNFSPRGMVPSRSGMNFYIMSKFHQNSIYHHRP